MTSHFTPKYRSLITISAFAFIALRYAYYQGYCDAQEAEDEKAREILRAAEETGTKSIAVSGAASAEVLDTNENENGMRNEDEAQEKKTQKVQRMQEDYKSHTQCEIKDRSHKKQGPKSESMQKIALSGRVRTMSQTVERRVSELGMDAARPGCTTAADWGLE